MSHTGFIPSFSALVQPLTCLLRKNTSSRWTEAEQQAFEAVKQVFLKSDLLKHPDNALPFIVESDVSDFALGGVLLQRDENELLRPVAF